MCVCVRVFLSVSFLWVQVPGTGPTARELEESEADIVLRVREGGGGGGGSLMLKGPCRK